MYVMLRNVMMYVLKFIRVTAGYFHSFWIRSKGSALFKISRKALGHLMKFTQGSIPYRFGLAG